LLKIEKNDLVKFGIIKSKEDKLKIIGICDHKILFDVECDYISKGALSLFEKNNHKVVIFGDIENKLNN
jgi:hypothetical protein